MSNNRRDFLKKSALLSLTGLAASVFSREKLDAMETVAGSFTEPGKITLPELPYPYGALEPYIDKQTMEIHHGKHHQAYINNLNTATVNQYNFGADPASNCKRVDANTIPLVRNNLGGHYNHSLFWTLMTPANSKKENKPSNKLNEALVAEFKSVDAFKKEFTEKATKVFGSGWCWLIMDENKKLKITTTSNQDNPLMQIAAEQGTPLLALDVWEHAYYLKYQNKRADYIAGWWNVVNWEKVSQLYSEA